MKKIWEFERLKKLSFLLWGSDFSSDIIRVFFEEKEFKFFKPWENFYYSFGDREERAIDYKFIFTVSRAIFSKVHSSVIWVGNPDAPTSPDYNSYLKYLSDTGSVGPCNAKRMIFAKNNNVVYKNKYNEMIGNYLLQRQYDKSKICKIGSDVSLSRIIDYCVSEELIGFKKGLENDREWSYVFFINEKYSMSIYFKITTPSDHSFLENFTVNSTLIIHETGRKFNVMRGEKCHSFDFLRISPVHMTSPNILVCQNPSDFEFSIRLIIESYKVIHPYVLDCIEKSFSL